MYLVVDELYPNVVFSQNFRIDRSMSVAHIRPWILKHGSALGDIVLRVKQNGGLLAESTVLNSDILAEVTGTYAHGQLRFDFDALQLNHCRENEYTEYTIELEVTGGALDENNFFAAIRRYELQIYDVYTENNVITQAPNDMVEALGFELYEWDQ